MWEETKRWSIISQIFFYIVTNNMSLSESVDSFSRPTLHEMILVIHNTVDKFLSDTVNFLVEISKLRLKHELIKIFEC